jgi:hypothetical protein
MRVRRLQQRLDDKQWEDHGIDRPHVAFIPKKKNKRLNDLYDFVSDDLFFLPSSLLW